MLIQESTPLYQEGAERIGELPDELLARAVIIGGAATPSALAAETTPEHHGVVSFSDDENPFSEDDLYDNLPFTEDAIFTVLGNPLWSVSSELDKKERLSQFPVALGVLASEASISTTTGCWSLVDKKVWRDSKGYPYVWDPESYGYKVDRTREFKGIRLHRMAFNMKRRLLGLPDLIPRQHLDHKCRWTGCCNIDHLEVVSRNKNNKLRDESKRFEAAIISGQIILGPTGRPQLDKLLLAAEDERTNIIITTTDGPRRLIKIDQNPLMFSAEPEQCDLVDSVSQPSLSAYERPSRARPPRIFKGQKSLFKSTSYKEKKVRKSTLYRKWQKTGQF